MLPLPPTSRRRFAAYMEQVRRRDRGDRDARPDLLAPGSERAVRRRQRGFFTLFAELLRITRAHNTTLAWSLVASTLATLLALIPLSATKLIIDHVLGGQPLPQSILDKAPRGLDLTHPPTLLWTVTVGMVALSLVAFFVTAVVLPPQDASVNINLGAGIAGMSFVAAASAIGSAKLAQRITDSDFLRIVPALVSVLAMLAALAGLVLVGVFLFEEIR